MSELPQPLLRDAPPWAMEEMILAEPELVRSILGDTSASPAVARIAGAISAAADPVRVTAVGCGTSEHAAMAMVALIREALVNVGRPAVGVQSRQAFEAALEADPTAMPDPGTADDLLIAISHEAETSATLAALRARRARVRAAVTANPAGPISAAADVAIETPLIDRSWCHTVGYVSPLAAGIRIAANVAGTAVDADAFVAAMNAVIGQRTEISQAARPLASARSFVVCGSGIDAIAARELALKIEEGVRLPAVARETETELHGHMVSATQETALICLVTDPRSVHARACRANQLLRAARRLGMPTLAILSDEASAIVSDDATTARMVIPGSSRADASADAGLATPLLTTAVALQLLTLELLTLHGRNPDLIGRETLDQREAAAIVSASFPI